MANFPDPDSWVRDSVEFGARMFEVLGNENVLAAQGAAVMNAKSGAKTADGGEQTLDALLVRQVGLLQEIDARLTRIEAQLTARSS